MGVLYQSALCGLHSIMTASHVGVLYQTASCGCTHYQSASHVGVRSIRLSLLWCTLYQSASRMSINSIRLPHTHLLIFPSQLPYCLPHVRLLFCKAFYKRLISFNMAEIFDWSLFYFFHQHTFTAYLEPQNLNVFYSMRYNIFFWCQYFQCPNSNFQLPAHCLGYCTT